MNSASSRAILVYGLYQLVKRFFFCAISYAFSTHDKRRQSVLQWILTDGEYQDARNWYNLKTGYCLLSKGIRVWSLQVYSLQDFHSFSS